VVVHPTTIEPGAGVASRTIPVPPGNWAEQVVAQLIPAGKLVTHPPPSPAKDTVTVTGAPDCTDSGFAALALDAPKTMEAPTATNERVRYLRDPITVE
jgi:hypothetical protein